MATSDALHKRRGSRREGAEVPGTLTPGHQPGFVERILMFESYTGFQHDWVGIVAGLLQASYLVIRRMSMRRR